MELTPAMLSKYAPQQREALMEHQRFSEKLKVQQAGVEKRKADLDVAGRLLLSMDSKVPAPARKLLTTQLAQHVGVDPKSEQFRSVQQVLTSLDPDSLTSIRQTFATSLKGAEPGAITEMIKGVMTGQVPFHELVQMTQSGAQAPSGDQNFDPNSTTNVAKTTDRLEPGVGQQEAAETQPPTSQTIEKPFQEGPGAIKSFEGQRTVPPANQQASPQLVGALGLDSTTRYRNDDLIKGGYRVPMDEKAQRDLAQSINTRATGISQTIRDAALMTKLFEGRPETLGPVGDFLRGLQSTIGQVEGIMRLIKPDMLNETDPSKPDINGLVPDAVADEVANKLAQAHNFDAKAEDAARIKSMVLGLAYRMAIARDIPGNRLTNAIINQHLVQIGHSASPDQFKTVLADTVSSLVREFDESMRRQLGANGSEIVARHLSNDDIKTMAQSADLLPPTMAGALRDEAVRRTEGGAGPTVKPSSPTLDEEERTLGQLETEGKKSEIEKRAFDRQIALAQEGRAARSEERAEGREDRMMEAQEASNKLARERFDFDVRKFETEQEKERYTKIRDAFLQFGAAIARGGGSANIGVSIPQQGGQDSSAFRIAPAPQRTPPRPVGT